MARYWQRCVCSGHNASTHCGFFQRVCRPLPPVNLPPVNLAPVNPPHSDWQISFWLLAAVLREKWLFYGRLDV